MNKQVEANLSMVVSKALGDNHGRNIDFLVFPCYRGAGLCAEQDSASVGASHLYGLFVDDSLWDGNYFAQPF